MATALMTLEVDPQDREAVAALFRETHTIKGTAGMVGLMGVSHLAHHLEDMLSELRSGEQKATPELTDGMLAMLDRLSRLLQRAAAGEVDPNDPDQPASEALAPTQPSSTPAVPTPSPALAPEIVAAAAAAPAATPPLPVNRRRVDATTLEVPISRIDELNRLVGEASAAQLRVGALLGAELHADPDQINEYRNLTNVINRLQEVTERTRMVPVGTLEPILQRTVRDTARNSTKNVRWEMVGGDVEVDRGVLEQLAAPLLHLVRNAVGHGIESAEERAASGKAEQATVSLRVGQVGSKVVIAVADDGRGINVDALRAAALRRGVDASNLSDDDALHLIFRSGVSTAKVLTEESGRGVGLDVVSTAVTAIHGQLDIKSRLGQGSEFRIVVPITLTVVPCLVVSVGGQSFAMPMHRIVRMVVAQPVEIVGGRTLAMIDGEAIPVTRLATLLQKPAGASGPWILMGDGNQVHAIEVDSVAQKRDVVVRGLQGSLRDLEVISGASVEPNGSVLLVLDVPALLLRANLQMEAVAAQPSAHPASARPLSVLVVEDSLMVRELQRSILERAGYRVRTATDGAEALALLGAEPSDLIITDIEMPGMDGFELIRAIRGHARMSNLPVLIVTSRSSEEDHKRGLELGADGYIVKTSFDEEGLLSAVSRLLGRSIDRSHLSAGASPRAAQPAAS